ncbi:MAG TPA: sigma-54 dependent transcriptional regulator [Polyangia bacterium]
MSDSAAALAGKPQPTPNTPGPVVLVVDDEPGIVDSLQKVFEREGLKVLTARAGSDALEILRREPISVLLTDLMMPGLSGMDLLKASRSVSPETETILMTAYGTVENAVEAMKQGAYDFVTKPITRAHVVRAVLKALEKRTLVQENRALRAQLAAQRKKRLIGQSLTWRRTMETVSQAAPSMATVLLLGESGTGKELLARAIHESSPRASGPFVPVNCAALPETILEAELFGYERGAFTGAVQRHDGRFLQADKGTLFLDEIGEIPTHIQVKLLRVLQEGEVERLGGRTQKIDIRLVAATNQDLRAAVKDGRFREDLYYRLNVIALRVPPLRERRDDIPLLAEHFLRLYSERNGRQFTGFARGALEALARCDWPGNVRELENAIERAVVLARGSAIEAEDLPIEVRSGGTADSDSKSMTFAVGTPLGEIERRVIHATLAHVGGDKRLCAQLLGIATRTIYRRLEEERGVDGQVDGEDVGDEDGATEASLSDESLSPPARRSDQGDETGP